MGQTQSTQKINFEDIQFVLKNHEQHVLINTLGANEQNCLLPNTMNALDEENIINSMDSTHNIINNGSNSTC